MSSTLPSISSINSSSIINNPEIQSAAAEYFGADPNHFELTGVGSAPAGASIDGVPQVDGLTVYGRTYFGNNLSPLFGTTIARYNPGYAAVETVKFGINGALGIRGAIGVFGMARAGLAARAAARTATTSVFWSGPGTQAAAEAFAANSGGRTLAVAADATVADIQAASAEFAAGAQGNVTVFQNAGSVYDIVNPSTWAAIEYPGFLANPNVTGVTLYLVDETGGTIWSTFVPKWGCTNEHRIYKSRSE